MTLVSATSPLFLTVIRNVAEPPGETVCELGFFSILIDGCVTGLGLSGARTVTWAESLAVTLVPLGGVPVATATFVKLAVTLSRLHV